MNLNGNHISDYKFEGSNGLITISSGTLDGSGTAPVTDGNSITQSGGTVVNQTIGNGGLLTILKGTASNTTIATGGSAIINNGLAKSMIVDGGSVDVIKTSGGASISFASNGSGGTITLESGVTFTNSAAVYAVSSGGSYVVNSGAVIDGGQILAGGNVVVNGGGTATNIVVSSGGTASIASGGSIGTLMTVSSGGTAIVNGTAGSGTISLAGDGAHLVISGTTMPANTILNWSPTDTIELASIPQASVTSVSTTASSITFHTTGGTYSLNVPGANNYGYNLSSDGKGGLIYTTCFAEGTAITTPDGEAAVETLVPGTLVMTPKGAMPVKWLGHRSITVSSQPVPEENWLVRIREGALADGVPSRDLLVTQEHCMVFEGKLVPARMLVNGASILIDRTINSYTYYHVELESHEAVWAENALTESYLDTGNRSQFDNHTVTAIFGGSKAGGSKTLPLETSRAFVEPIYARIAERAGGVAHQPELTADPDMHLVTNFGQIIRPLRQANDRVMFMLPENVTTVRLVSRASRPSDTIGPFVDDRRDLGVLVGDVSLFAPHQTVSLTAHLSLSNLSGWHGLESSTYRWTDGDATLPLQSENISSEPGILSIQVVSSGPYLMEDLSVRPELRQVG